MLVSFKCMADDFQPESEHYIIPHAKSKMYTYDDRLIECGKEKKYAVNNVTGWSISFANSDSSIAA